MADAIDDVRGTRGGRLPAVFIGHGSPMNTLENNRYTQAWRDAGQAIGKPKAILAISAHWYIRGVAVTAMDRPETIHDFGGFPAALHAFQYPAAGMPDFARRVRMLLAPLDVRLDQEWGLDHGTWSVLAHVFPDASVPVVQLSLDATRPATFHYELGRRLAPLRDEGVLIVGSGNVVHNLRAAVRQTPSAPYPWATTFNDQVRDHLRSHEHAALVDYLALGDPARMSVPTPEHYLPMVYIAGLQREDEALTFIVDGIEAGSIGMLAFAVGDFVTTG
jgi:4,5-DOPA dioxygenase extradiol